MGAGGPVGGGGLVPGAGEIGLRQGLEGARGKHKVDVVVRFAKHHFECFWVVECKLWSSNVPKEKVLALQAIIDDVGADKGIILSEKGFQSGCFACAQRSNILLSSLSELRETHEDDRYRTGGNLTAPRSRLRRFAGPKGDAFAP